MSSEHSAPLPFNSSQALGLATVLGGVLAVVLVTCSDGALALMGAGPETGHVHELATEFLTIRWVLVCCAKHVERKVDGSWRGCMLLGLRQASRGGWPATCILLGLLPRL